MDKQYQIRFVINTGRPYPVIAWDDFSEEWPMGISFDGVKPSHENEISQLCESVIGQKRTAKTPDEKRAAWHAKQDAETKLFKIASQMEIIK